MKTEQAPQKIHDIETILQHHMNLFGYELVDMPIIADAEIFLTRAGNSIVEQLFTFERFGKLLALRPEFTALLAHQYAKEGYTHPVRWQLSGSIFVDEPSDYSLQYQQHNIGAEFIGQANALADAEMMAMAVTGIETLGIEDYQLIIGHVGLQLHLLAQFGLDSRTQHILLTQRDRLRENGKQAVLDYLSDILMLGTENTQSSQSNGEETQTMLDILLDSTRYSSTMGGRTRHDIVERIVKKYERGLDYGTISKALDFLQRWRSIRGTFDDAIDEIRSFIPDNDEYGNKLLEEWLEIVQLLFSYGIEKSQIIIQPDLTKNWDYYTGFVFGIRVKNEYVASGGRYDGLTRLLGSDEAIPAVGFAYYSQPLTQALPSHHSENMVYTLTGIQSDDIVQWSQELRSAGIAIKSVTGDETADIVIDRETAEYKDNSFTLEQLIQELTL